MDAANLLSNLEGFDWDKGNADKNFIKHGVTNEEAAQVFTNTPKVLLKDQIHSIVEIRYILWGKTDKERNLAVVFTIRDRQIRVISARDMNTKERKSYEEKT